MVSEFNDFISHGIDIRNLHFSTSRKVVLDTSTFEIYDCRSFASWELNNIASIALKGSAKFILDGQYIAMISKSCRELLLVRSCDGVQKGRIYIHGKANILAVASDDRTVLVGCSNGRMMSFTVVLDTPDPVHDVVRKLPSRAHCPAQKTGVLQSDIHKLNTKLAELKHLSADTQFQHSERQKHVPTFKSVGTAVMLTQGNSHRMSRACVIL